MSYDPTYCARGSGLPWTVCPCSDCGFTRHLNVPCDEDGCIRPSDHNQAGRTLCNEHLDPELPAFARND